jgi:hypothetical protein
MGKILTITLVFASFLLVPSADLSANSIDLFTLKGAWSGTTGTQPFAAVPFTLQFKALASPMPFSSDPFVFQIFISGSYINNGTTTLFPPISASIGGFWTAGGTTLILNDFLAPGNIFAIDASAPGNPVVFSGATSSPTFILGTYNLNGSGQFLIGPPDTENFAGTLTIAPVPEPATVQFLLLGLSAVGLVGRRKFSS